MKSNAEVRKHKLGYASRSTIGLPNAAWLRCGLTHLTAPLPRHCPESCLIRSLAVVFSRIRLHSFRPLISPLCSGRQSVPNTLCVDSASKAEGLLGRSISSDTSPTAFAS